MGLLYAKDGKLHASQPLDICVPLEYEPVNQGVTIETFGLLFIRPVDDGQPGEVKLMMVPATISLSIYDTEEQNVKIHGKLVRCLVCHYLKDLPILNQFVVKSRERAEEFLRLVMNGKLPKVIDYAILADTWWRNLEISGISFRVPSKIYELILATVYRNPANMKQRFGEIYGKQPVPDGFHYATGNVRDIVANLSTFSGFIYEDLGRMITSGVNNSMEGVEEPVSPLEKIINY